MLPRGGETLSRGFSPGSRVREFEATLGAAETSGVERLDERRAASTWTTRGDGSVTAGCRAAVWGDAGCCETDCGCAGCRGADCRDGGCFAAADGAATMGAACRPRHARHAMVPTTAPTMA